MTASSETRLVIPFKTVAVVLGTIVGVRLVEKIAPLLLPFLLGLLLAVSLEPLVCRLTRRGLSRGLAVVLLLTAFLLLVAGLCWFALPPIYNQLSGFVAKLPELKDRLLASFPKASPFHDFAARNLGRGAVPAQISAENVLMAGGAVLGSLTELVLVIVFAAYLMIDGPRLRSWLLAFFAPQRRARIHQACSEVSEVVFAYVAGQCVTSAASFVYVFAALKLLHVPSALMLAALSALFDILPVLGFVLAVVPAMLFSLQVSPATPVYVLGAYLLYHALENYWIAPAVYGSRMRLSSFVVLVSLLAAGMVAGVEGAIVVLPIVASYPILERIFLLPLVGRETVQEHAEIESAD